MRRLVPALVALASLSLPLAACGTSPAEEPPAPRVVSRSVLLGRLQTQVADVAESQQAADARLAEALTAVRELDAMIARLRDPETVDEAKDRMPRVDAALAGADLEPLRPAIRDIALEVDQARAALAAVRDDAPADEQAYLEAQDAALVAMRAYAQSADALVQVLERHWPLYLSIRDTTETFVEQRWFYRTSEEATQAYEVELSDRISPLATAQEEIASFRRARDAAAEQVNATSRAAARIFRDRPSPAPTATP